MIGDILRHVEAFESRLRRVEVDWSKLKRVWNDMIHTMTSFKAFRLTSRRLALNSRRVEWCCTSWWRSGKMRGVIEAKWGDYHEFDILVWMGLWWVTANWRRLRHVGTRKWRSRGIVSVGGAKCDDLLWVRHVCYMFGELQGFAWRMVKSDGTSALNLMSEDEVGTIYNKLKEMKTKCI